MRNIFLILLISLATAFSNGCSDGTQNNSRNAAPKPDDALATDDAKTDIQRRFQAYLKFKRIEEPDKQRRDRLLKEYLEREALADAVETEDLLDKDLLAAELDEFRKQMLVSRYFEKYLDRTVTDQAVENYYKTHPEEFENREVHAAHVLVRTNPEMSDIERKARLTTAHEAWSKIRSGESFAEVAKNYSDDRISGKKGGDLGWIKEGRFDKRFTEVAFSLEPGEVSEPVETDFGFHVIKNIEGPRTVKRPFKAAAGDIRYMLRNKAKKAETARLIEKARSGE